MVSHPSKCSHGVYWPAADPINLGCQACNPDGLGGGDVPVLPRSSSDTLGRHDEHETCHGCGNIRTYFSQQCRHCGAAFPDDGARSRGQETANRLQLGACPECGSTVHYETKKKSEWECADCGKKYKALKLKDTEE
jgi:predicted RNA-binding Zn-ribbon protein involved in translation (DUF1610 family)